MKGDRVCTLPADLDTDRDLEIRIRAEFREMPGLKLTLPQASRLFNVEQVRCEQILEALVTHGALSTCGGLVPGKWRISAGSPQATRGMVTSATVPPPSRSLSSTVPF
jgi:hypothetical protein